MTSFHQHRSRALGLLSLTLASTVLFASGVAALGAHAPSLARTTSEPQVARMPAAVLAATPPQASPAPSGQQTLRDPLPAQAAQQPQARQEPQDPPASQTASDQQEPPAPPAPPKRDKNAPVTVRGCLDDVMLLAVEADETIPELTPTLRLLAKKDVKKQLKTMNGYHVEVTGLLKLPPKSPLRKKIGNTTVSVGLGDPRAPQNSPMYQQQLDYGTLDVTQAVGLGTRCNARR